MHRKTHMRNEPAPIHQGGPGRLTKVFRGTTLAVASMLPVACTQVPYQAHMTHRAIGMSPATLMSALQQAKNPQMTLDALLNYGQYSHMHLSPYQLNMAREELNRVRFAGVFLSPDQEKKIIMTYFSLEQALPPVVNPVEYTNDGTA